MFQEIFIKQEKEDGPSEIINAQVQEKEDEPSEITHSQVKQEPTDSIGVEEIISNVDVRIKEEISECDPASYNDDSIIENENFHYVNEDEWTVDYDAVIENQNFDEAQNNVDIALKNGTDSYVKCTYCDKMCRSFSSLKQHIIYVHFYKNVKQKYGDILDCPMCQYTGQVEETRKHIAFQHEFEQMINDETAQLFIDGGYDLFDSGESEETLKGDESKNQKKSKELTPNKAKSKISCTYCIKKCPSLVDLKRHIIYCHFYKAIYEKYNEKLVECPKCDYSGKSADDFKKHIAFCHEFQEMIDDKTRKLFIGVDKNIIGADAEVDEKGKPIVKCLYCFKIFPSLNELKRHIVYSHLYENIKQKYKNMTDCPKCEYAATNVEAIRKHIAFCHDFWDMINEETTNLFDTAKQETIFCPYCESGFAYKSNLKYHIVRVHLKAELSARYGDNLKNCPKCDNYNGKIDDDLIQIHIGWNHDFKDMINEETKIIFQDLLKKEEQKEAIKATKAGRGGSKRDHERQFSCTSCNNMFLTKKNLKAHIINVHLLEKLAEKYGNDLKGCPKCDTFPNSSDMKKIHLHLGFCHDFDSMIDEETREIFSKKIKWNQKATKATKAPKTLEDIFYMDDTNDNSSQQFEEMNVAINSDNFIKVEVDDIKSNPASVKINQISTQDSLQESKSVNQESLQSNGKFICTFCRGTFLRKKNLKAHIVKLHLLRQLEKNYGFDLTECPKCDEFPKNLDIKQIHLHLGSFHDFEAMVDHETRTMFAGEGQSENSFVQQNSEFNDQTHISNNEMNTDYNSQDFIKVEPSDIDFNAVSTALEEEVDFQSIYLNDTGGIADDPLKSQPIPCNFLNCSESFDNKSKFKQHIVQRHLAQELVKRYGNNPTKCPKCDIFDNKANTYPHTIRRHIGFTHDLDELIDEETRQYLHSLVDRRKVSKKDKEAMLIPIKRTIDNFNDEPPSKKTFLDAFSCTLCEVQFKHLSNLRQHFAGSHLKPQLVERYGVPITECPKCDTFANKPGRTHLVLRHIGAAHDFDELIDEESRRVFEAYEQVPKRKVPQ